MPVVLDPDNLLTLRSVEQEDHLPIARRWPKWRWPAAQHLFAAAIAIGGIATRSRSSVPTDYITAPASRGDIVRMTTASGMVNPVETVQIGSYVSGRIQSLSCDYNTEVVEGPKSCAKIDPRSYQAAVDRSAAGRSAPRRRNPSQGPGAARLCEGHLRAKSCSAQSQRDLAGHAADNALNAYKQSDAQVALDQAAITQREAELQSPLRSISNTPTVLCRRSMAPSSRDRWRSARPWPRTFQTPTLFLIATDLKKMQVEANVSEAEIGEIRDGQ